MLHTTAKIYWWTQLIIRLELTVVALEPWRYDGVEPSSTSELGLIRFAENFPSASFRGSVICEATPIGIVLDPPSEEAASRTMQSPNANFYQGETIGLI